MLLWANPPDDWCCYWCCYWCCCCWQRWWMRMLVVCLWCRVLVVSLESTESTDTTDNPDFPADRSAWSCHSQSSIHSTLRLWIDFMCEWKLKKTVALNMVFLAGNERWGRWPRSTWSKGWNRTAWCARNSGQFITSFSSFKKAATAKLFYCRE